MPFCAAGSLSVVGLGVSKVVVSMVKERVVEVHVQTCPRWQRDII